jgi:hypothetical protein
MPIRRRSQAEQQRFKNNFLRSRPGLKTLGEGPGGAVVAIGSLHPQANDPGIREAILNLSPGAAGRALSRTDFAQGAATGIETALDAASQTNNAKNLQLLGRGPQTIRNLGFAGSDIDQAQRASQDPNAAARDISAEKEKELEAIGQIFRRRNPGRRGTRGPGIR